MSPVYLESSSVLAWLFGESTSAEVLSVINQADQVVASVLTDLEVRRSLVRAQITNAITEAVAAHMLGVFEVVSRAWIFMEMSPEVRRRASMRFPVEPIRSLDAIHLATALEFLRAVDDLRVLSLDRRILDNIGPLGLPSALDR